MVIVLLLLAQLAATQPPLPPPPPNPRWVETPIPHWSCPPGFDLIPQPAPHCLKPTKAEASFFLRTHDATIQEEIFWGWVKIVPASGVLRIDYPPEFLKMPGCEVIDKTNEKSRIRFSRESKTGLFIHATPRHKLHLNCRGVLAR